jgi:hypothetical protein
LDVIQSPQPLGRRNRGGRKKERTEKKKGNKKREKKKEERTRIGESKGKGGKRNMQKFYICPS